MKNAPVGARVYLANANPARSVEADQGRAPASVRLKVLLSFHYYRDTDLDELFEKKFAPHYPEVFVDSGGFSAMTQGVHVGLADYAAYLKRFAHRITTYANLDVIGDAPATLDNQKRLEDLGLRPLPVFHAGEDFEYLERYVEAYPYVALGGMVPYMRQWRSLMPWIVRCFKAAAGRAVYHGFGCTTWSVVSRVPWYSVDSSSWCASFRFGTVNLFDPRTGTWQDFSLGDQKSCSMASKLIREYGFDPADFADRKRNDRKKIAAISALAYIRAEQFLRARHGEVRVPERGAGARMYIANTYATHFALASHELNATGARVYLADPTPPHAKDSAGVSEMLNAPPRARVYLADTSSRDGYRAHDASNATRSINGDPT